MFPDDRLLLDAQKIVDSCVCFQARKIARTISHLYDNCLQPSGLRITQFYLLLTIYLADSPTVTSLAQALQIDQTTMTRNLKLLEKQGLIDIATGCDRRTRLVYLTQVGRETIAQAVPLWQQAQAQTASELGEDAWQLLSAIAHFANPLE